MKAKKWLALAVTIALIVVPVQVALADGLDNQVVSGDAIVDYINPSSIVSVTAATSASLSFTLDPQNLAATQGVGVWDPSLGGSIIPAAVGIIVNESAVPIKASVHFTMQDGSTNKAVLVDKTSDVNVGTDKNMYLSFVPAKSKTSVDKALIAAAAAPVFVKNDAGDAPATFTEANLTAAGVTSTNMLTNDKAATATFGQFVETEADSGVYNQVEVPAHADVAATTQTTVSAYTATETGLGDTTSAAVLKDAAAGVDMAYALNKANYYVIKKASGFNLVCDSAARNDNYDTGSFIVSGLINKNADWSGYDATKKITVTASYSFEIMTKEAYDTAKAAKLGSSYNSIAPAATVSGVTVTPATATVIKGATKDFTAVVAGANNPSQAVTWSVSGNDKAETAIDSTGKLTVAADETAATLTVTATSPDDGTKTGTATVTVSEPAATVSSVTVSPDTATVIKGETKDFTAAVAGAHSPAQTVTWSVTGKNSADTAIDATGKLTVGADETAETLTVTATSTVDDKVSGTATVTVSAPAATVSSVAVSPSTFSMEKGTTKSFSATVTGTNSPAQTVTWSVSGNAKAGTTIDASGVLTVATNETASSLTVTATSTVDGSKSGTATVLLNKVLTAGTPLTSFGVTKEQATAGYTFLLNKDAGGTTHPTGTILTAYWAATATNDIKGVMTYAPATGILTLKPTSWPDSVYAAKLVITMSSGEVFTINTFTYPLS